MKLKMLLGLTLVIATITLTGCDGSEQSEGENTGAVACEGVSCSIENTGDKEANVQIANPASEKCLADGGTLLPQKDADGGEYALCQLADGTVCEEWSYFRGECPGVTA